ncbi:helix-turn-helix domain-containing protein [Streptomyces sp. NRRL S-337]|uniref:helix-turn-helix domain-containing protein n=1 Tax=Streptomyces sp. NRRL S-337 TaxID=1463900 RepID=UPI00068A584B|nr:XRE family transcriptional regulator [Streptomyces sp. NRRL S-337]
MSGPGSGLCEGVESSRLAAGMRELRGRTGLSLAALAARTPYSKSSWERYLNGKKLPPRAAVEALCRLAGEPAGRLLALWELADAAWSGRAAPAADRAEAAAARDATVEPGPAAETHPAQPQQQQQPQQPEQLPPPRRYRRVVAVVAGAGAGVLALVVAVTFLAGERAGEARGGPAASATPSSSAVTGCRGRSCDGKDPQSMFCGGEGMVDTVVEATTARGEHIQVRYGTACEAAWGRLRDGRIGDRIEVTAPGSLPRSVRVRDRFDAEGYLVTPMAAARGPRGVRLCLYPAGGGPRECFAH